MKYINAEKLKEKIESISLIPQASADYNDGRDDVKMIMLDLIDSLQQEQPELYKKDESLGSPDYERGFKHGSDYQTEVTRKYTNKDKVVAYLVDKGYPISTAGEIPTYQETFDMVKNAIKHANKQKKPEVNIEKTLNGFQNFYAYENSGEFPSAIEIAKHFYELGLKAMEE